MFDKGREKRNMHERRESVKMMNEEREDNVVRKVERGGERMNIYDIGANDPDIKVVTPIVFTSAGELDIDYNLSSLPIERLAQINNIINDNKEVTMAGLTRSNLSNLNRNSVDILVSHIVSYIKHQSIMSICSAINFGEANKHGYLDYIPVKEYISNEILSTETNIGFILRSTLYDVDYSCLGTDDSEAIMRTGNIVNNVAYQIIHLIRLYICTGCQRAINDFVMGVYSVPNIDMLYNKIMNKTSVDNNSPVKKEDVPTIVASILSDLLMEDIERAMAIAISPMILDIIRNMHITKFDMYDREWDNRMPTKEDLENCEFF